MKENHVRSVVKGISWRLIGTMDTIFLSFLFTGKADKALQIGGIELFTKIVLFYVHERIWMGLHFGTNEILENGHLIRRDKHWRSIVKGISWRIIGSLDTFWIAVLVNRESPHATTTAFYIAATEVFSKILLFWLHERVWIKVKWGIKPTPVNTQNLSEQI